MFLLFCNYYWYAIYGTIKFSQYDILHSQNLINNTYCDILYPYIKTPSIISFFALPVINEFISIFWGIKIKKDYEKYDNCDILDIPFYANFYHKFGTLCLPFGICILYSCILYPIYKFITKVMYPPKKLILI